jgi:hypothetical protein
VSLITKTKLGLSATIENKNIVVIVDGNKGVRHRKVINKYTIEGAHVGSIPGGRAIDRCDQRGKGDHRRGR